MRYVSKTCWISLQHVLMAFNKNSLTWCFLLPRKSVPQWQIHRREVIPEFFHPFKPFGIQNFAMENQFCRVTCFVKVFLLFFALKQFYNVVHTSSQISLRLLLKMWIWYRYENRIEKYYHQNWKTITLGFYKKVHIKSHRSWAKRRMFL